MKCVSRVVSRALVLGLVTTFSIGVAVAGPLENGVKAYSSADYSGAVKILETLAQKGDADAQYTLGLAYSKLPSASTEDKMKAVMWLDLVARTGDADAASERDKIGADLKPDEFTDAKKRADGWKPQ